MLDCRGPLQTYWSSGRQKQEHAHVAFGGIKPILYVANISRGQSFERCLAEWCLAAAVEINRRSNENDRYGRAQNVLAFHTHRVSTLAAALAMICGKTIEMSTKIVDSHSRIVVIALGRRWHFLARRA